MKNSFNKFETKLKQYKRVETLYRILHVQRMAI